MAIYTFVQNDALAPVDAIRVWVIADSADQALNTVMGTDNSFYLDPDFNNDCPCCGNRWSDNPVVVSTDDISSVIDRDTRWVSSRSYLADVIMDSKAVRCDSLQDVMNALGL